MQRSLNKKKIISYVVLVVLVVASIFYVMFHFGTTEDGKTRLMEVRKIDFIQKVTVPGTVTPFRQTIITAPYTGYIKKIYVKVGQKVESGDPLVSIVESLQTEQKVYPVRAPYSGVVVLIPKSEGEFVKKDQESNFILKIDDLHELYINSNVPEGDIPKIKVGQEVVIKATSILDKKYSGIVKIVSLSPEQNKERHWSDRGQVRYPVSILITGGKKGLTSGMSVIADITITKEKDVLVLPHEFVQKKGERHFIVTEDGKEKDVVVGLQNPHNIVIKSGVEVGTKVKQTDYFKE